MEPSVTFSGSDDGQLSDSTETPEQTEDMSYRETVRSIRSSWAGITSPPLRLIILSLTNPIIPGRARTQGNRQGYRWLCPRLCQKLERPRPIQWHLKRHWHVPEVLEKVILVPPSLHPHLDWWLDEGNVLGGQPLHPLQHALQLFTDASNEGWGAHLGDSIARGIWSPIESRLHINFLELKVVLLALKKFEHLCRDKIVLVATDNTTVVSYINKQGGMKSGSLCALLWRLLSWWWPQ